MISTSPAPTFTRGFTLTEMAVVLVIVALLIGGLLMPLSTQQDLRSIAETQKQLTDIREALIGFAASKNKPYLPCPDTSGDGQEDRTGATCTGALQEGDLPWATLGLGRQDAWGNPFRYRVATAFSDSSSGFTLTSTGDLRICTSSACSAVLASALPAVVVSLGKNGGALPTDADELKNKTIAAADSDFVQRTPEGDNTGFDDLLTWLPPPVLMYHMLTAGRLP